MAALSALSVALQFQNSKPKKLSEPRAEVKASTLKAGQLNSFPQFVRQYQTTEASDVFPVRMPLNLLRQLAFWFAAALAADLRQTFSCWAQRE